MTAEKPDQNAGPGPDAEPPVAANDGEPAAAEAAEAVADAAAAPAEAGPEQEIADLKDRLLRAMAEVENMRRRAARDVEDARKYAVAGIARDLLSVADNLRRALDAVPAEARDGHADLNNLMTGVELTERELQKAFDKAGISVVDPLGQRLDPNLHQAMMQVPHPTAEPGTVVQVVQVGYKIHDRLLRPAMVGVAMAPAGEQPGGKVDQQA
jgi:molecular chaperone GrpE